MGDAILKGPKIHTVVTGHNCERFVDKCVDSFARQSYQNFKIIFVSDGSTDRTADRLESALRNRIAQNPRKWAFSVYSENKFAAFRRYEAIKQMAEDDPSITGESIFMTVDLDDWLRFDALEIIANRYQDKDCWMTYGTWINHKGKVSPVCLDYSDEDIANRDFRKLPYRPVSPNTFRKKLWDKIPESDYKDEKGNWLEVCTETGFRLSCLEMCGMNRVRIIRDPIYIYNAWLPNNTQRKYGQEYKNTIRDYVFAQRKKGYYEQE